MGRLTRSHCAVILVAAPAIAVAIAWITVLALAVLWRHPMWGLTPRNLAEAAAFRDGAAIVQMVRQGHDINAAGEVREGFIARRPVVVTPLEAAVDGRRGEIVRLLLHLGASPDAATIARLWCRTDDSEIRTILKPPRPEDATALCLEPRHEP
jgi:hypothetical protein